MEKCNLLRYTSFFIRSDPTSHSGEKIFFSKCHFNSNSRFYEEFMLINRSRGKYPSRIGLGALIPFSRFAITFNRNFLPFSEGLIPYNFRFWWNCVAILPFSRSREFLFLKMLMILLFLSHSGNWFKIFNTRMRDFFSETPAKVVRCKTEKLHFQISLNYPWFFIFPNHYYSKTKM